MGETVRWTEILQALAAPVGVVIALIIGWWQAHLQRLQNNHSLFILRMNFYLELRNIFVEAMRTKVVPEHRLAWLLSNDPYARFLFGQDMAQFLDKVYKKGVKFLILTGKTVGFDPPQIQRAKQDANDAHLWFCSDSFKELDQVSNRYLQLQPESLLQAVKVTGDKVALQCQKWQREMGS
jgi:hypothetical protein